MSQSNEQNLSNHARFDPPYHFFLSLGVLLFIGGSIYQTIKNPTWGNGAHIFVALWLAVLWFRVRTYPLKVQDRLIRLEERLRLAQLLPESTRGRIGELSEGQLIGLRFASDAEIPALVEKTLAEKLNNKQIKQNIKN